MAQLMHTIRIGFLPLLDAALPIIASVKGFGEEEGLDLQLFKEISWANIRDRMATGHFDMAHMLAPMPIAAKLGLTPMKMDLIVPMSLGLGGNAVTIATKLYEEMRFDAGTEKFDARAGGSALRELIERRKSKGAPKLIFAVVHPHSAHNYDLRYWLSASGINPDRDIEIIVIPPSFMPSALSAGKVDGFCVGAPWNSVAASSGAGTIVTTKSEIWRSSPEKVLGISKMFNDEKPEQVLAVVRALVRAAQWCGNSQNHEEMAHILAAPAFLDLDAKLIEQSIKGIFPIHLSGKRSLAHVPDYFVPFKRAATFPWQSHGLWFYTQMIRWGHADWDPAMVDDVSSVYRPDIYRSALASSDIPLPGASSKVEGALRFETPVGVNKGTLILGPDGFFDEQLFDPDNISAYVRNQMA